MKTITRTIYGNFLTTSAARGIPFKVLPNTTLNEKLGINVDATRNAGGYNYPQLKYLCIGNGGHEAIMSGPVPKIGTLQHKSTDPCPFNMIPFVLREMDNDLPPGVREQYALRRTQDIDGTTYIAYYLKRLDQSNDTVEVNKIVVNDDGTTTVTPFLFDDSLLNPQPTRISHSGVNVLDSVYIDTSNLLTIRFTPEDCAELRNVANILYNEEESAVISEFGLVSGIDYRATVTIPGSGQVAINEVIAAQLNNIHTTYRSCFIDNLGFTVNFKIGNSVPLWLSKPQNATP